MMDGRKLDGRLFAITLMPETNMSQRWLGYLIHYWVEDENDLCYLLSNAWMECHDEQNAEWKYDMNAE